MKKLLLLLAMVGVLAVACESGGNQGGDDGKTISQLNKIYYTTTDGKKLFPTESGGATFGAILISNTYADGQGVLIFDDTVTSIGNGAFQSCTSLTSVTIPDGVTSIGSDAFSDCTSLKSVTIPDSVTEIGDSAFSDCTSLTSVIIGNSVTSIGDSAFRDCTSLTSVTIPDSVTSIGYAAFYDCTSLSGVIIPNSVISIGMEAFSGCTSLTTITIPDSVTSIGIGAFCYCTSLKAFYGKFASSDHRCLIVDGVLNSFAPAGLTEYTILNSVVSIGECVFWGCEDLISVTIPDSVSSIKYRAFYGCSGLTRVFCESITPPMGYADMFDDNASDRKIYVPRNSVEAYKSAEYWSRYADYIEGYDF